MGFLEGLILSFVAGWINSYLYRKYLRKRNKDWIVFLAVIFLSILWMIDSLIYFDIINMTWLNFLPWVSIPSIDQGKYFLWNSFIVFGIDFHINHQPGMELIACFLLISYLFWYYLKNMRTSVSRWLGLHSRWCGLFKAEFLFRG